MPPFCPTARLHRTRTRKEMKLFSRCYGCWKRVISATELGSRVDPKPSLPAAAN